MIDVSSLTSQLRAVVQAQPKQLKGDVVILRYDGSGPYVSPPIAMARWNALHVRVVPPSGTNISATVRVQGSFGGGAGADLSDPNAVVTNVTTPTTLDVVVGTLWATVRLENVVGTPDPGQAWRIEATPYVAAAQSRQVATVL